MSTSGGRTRDSGEHVPEEIDSGREAASETEKLRDRVNCPSCGGLYRQPKLLPCLHEVCTPCLEEVVVSLAKEGKREEEVLRIECPVCQRSFPLPANGIKGYQSSLATITLIEVHSAVEKCSTASEVNCDECQAKAIEYCYNCRKFACDFCCEAHKRYSKYEGHQVIPIERIGKEFAVRNVKPEALCPNHRGEKLHLFCETCRELICRDCTLSTLHRQHSFDYLTEENQRCHRKQMTDSLKTQSEFLDLEAASIRTRKEEINRQSSSKKAQIESHIAQAKETLDRRKESLLATIDEQVSEPLSRLKERSQHVELLRKQLAHCDKLVSESLELSGLEGLLSMERTISSRIDEIATKRSQLASTKTPESEYSASLTTTTSKSHLVPFFPQSMVVTGVHFPAPDEVSSGDPLSLLTTRSYLPSAGHDRVCKVLGIPVRTIGGVTNPHGITVSGRHILVCDVAAHHVAVLDFQGRRDLTLGRMGEKKSQFMYPYSIVMDCDSKALVTDLNCRIQMFNSNGKCVKSVGEKGSKKLEFNYPVGMAIGRQNQVYVCEREGNRIQVLNRDLSFRAFIGQRGKGRVQFNYPSDVAVDNEGNLYVADGWNHRIQVLTEDGTFLREFGHKGSGNGELNWPSNLCVDPDGFVYVTEIRNHRVSVFHSNGDFVMVFGSKGSGMGQFCDPHGIVMDDNRVLYVSDSGNNRICVFK